MLARAQELPPSPLGRVAVILNGRARGVSPRVLRRIGRLMPLRDLYVSRSIGDSSAIAGEVVDGGYQAVLLGGGDGTFVQCLTDIATHARRRGAPLPSVGVLRLGTGNALAHTLGASAPTEAGLARDLGRAADPRRGPLPLLDVDGRLTPFAGLGLDAQILEDFNATTRFLDTAGIGRGLGPGVRYALAVAFRSIPRFLARPAREVIAVNLGSPAFRVGAGGRLLGDPIPAGEILYRGPCSLAAGSTIPYYGLGMRMFPHAQLMQGRFQLRCSGASTPEILAHLPGLFRGTYASKNIGDFLVDKVELRLAEPAPVQIGGDLQPGTRDRLVLSLASRPVDAIFH
jgi:diacylglycerol kinase family enzyme